MLIIPLLPLLQNAMEILQGYEKKQKLLVGTTWRVLNIARYLSIVIIRKIIQIKRKMCLIAPIWHGCNYCLTVWIWHGCNFSPPMLARLSKIIGYIFFNIHIQVLCQSSSRPSSTLKHRDNPTFLSSQRSIQCLWVIGEVKVHYKFIIEVNNKSFQMLLHFQTFMLFQWCMMNCILPI